MLLPEFRLVKYQLTWGVAEGSEGLVHRGFPAAGSFLPRAWGRPCASVMAARTGGRVMAVQGAA